jgi:hypothetical protein
MMDVDEKKRKITELIQQRGPSLPIHVARGTELSMLFASAILSEMVSNKLLNVSHLKVGGSPLYYLPGQEGLLENFSNYLSGKEKDAFLLIKKHNLLEDERLQPAYRVAIRSMKDFAIPLSVKTQDGEKIFWRFHSFPKEKAIEKINSILSGEKKAGRLEKKEKAAREKPEEKRVKPRAISKAAEAGFAKSVYDCLSKENIKIIGEEEKKKKSMVMRVLVSSSLGEIEMLAVAKDKKTITENDVRLLVSHSQSRRLPILLLCTGKPLKKAMQEIENFKSLLFLKQLY